MIKGKHALFTLAVLFICVKISAQRIQSEKVKVAYNLLPNKPLNPEFTTYSASVRTKHDALSNAGYTADGLVKKYFKLRAFKMLPTGGHFHLNATVGRFSVESSKVKSVESTVSDKEGNKSKIMRYYRDIIYRLPVTMTMEDMHGNIIEQTLYNSPGEGLHHKFTIGGRNFNSIAELNKAWDKGTKTYNELQKEAIKKAFQEFSNLVRNNYDILEWQSIDPILIPTGKKVPGADQFEQQALKAVEILNAIKADAPIGNAKDDLQPMISFWMEQKNNFSPSDKKEKRVHHACLYNIALVYLHLDNFEKAKTYGEAALATGEKKGITQYLIKDLQKKQKKALDQGVASLHFPIDLSDAAGPEGADYTHLSMFRERVDKVRDISSSFEGYYITTTGDSIRGTYVFSDGNDEEPEFFEGGNAKFQFDKDAELVEWTITPDKFKRGFFNGQLFTVIQKRPSSVSLKKISYAVTYIEDGPKMALLQAYPMVKNNNGSEYSDQLLILVKVEEDYINIGDLLNPRFVNWRKGFAGLFEDCEVLHAEVSVGKYKRDTHSIAKAIRLYNENDCE